MTLTDVFDAPVKRQIYSQLKWQYNISEQDISCTVHKGSVTYICILYMVETPQLWQMLGDNREGYITDSVKFKINSVQ
jgi:hypothetical protein